MTRKPRARRFLPGLLTRSLGGGFCSGATGGAIERGVGGPALEGLLGSWTNLGEAFFTASIRFFAGGCLVITSRRIGRRVLGFAFVGRFAARTTDFFATVAFFRDGAARFTFAILTFCRTTFLPAADAALLGEGFLAFAATAFLDGRGLAFFLFDAERFDAWLEDLRRKAGTRLLIMGGFQREQLGRDLRACRRL